MQNDLQKLEASLWEAADQLRANSKLNATEYSMPVMGMGLKVAHAVMDKHGGTISARRNHGRPGMTFTPELPLDGSARCKNSETGITIGTRRPPLAAVDPIPYKSPTNT